MLLITLLLLFAQGIPSTRADSSTVSGVLRDPSGKPAGAVRVAAAALSDPADPTPGGVLVSITETDGQGHFRLENIPPGRYYITAGRIDLPTYFPGTLDVRAGTVVSIAPSTTISGVEFVLKNESSSRASVMLFSLGPPGLNVPLQITVEDGGKIPIIAGTNYPVLRLSDARSGKLIKELLLNSATVNLPIPSPSSPGEYSVRLDDLPEGYSVRSIRYGTGTSAVDLTKELLRVSSQDVASYQSALISYTSVLSSLVTALPSNLGLAVPTSKTLFVVLSRTPAPKLSGVRVTGIVPPSDIPVYLSGVPGVLFSDGSFEFSGVAPGRHTLVRAVSTSTSQGLVLVVGDRDLDGVKPIPTALLPLDIESDAPRAAGNHAAGTILPLASIKGKVVQETSGEPLSRGGAVTITGYRNSRRAYALDGEGRFEIPDLLPGSYRIELEAYGYQTNIQTIVIDDGDIEMSVRAQPESSPQ
jgi:hypothetical protein